MTTHPYRLAAEAGDPAAVARTMASDVVLNSPISMRTTFHGADELRVLYSVVYEAFEWFRFTEEHEVEGGRVFRISGRIGGADIDEIQLVKLDEEGRIRELTLFVRPLPGLTAFAAALGPRLARRRSGVLGAVVALMLWPIALVTRVGDLLGTPIVRGKGLTAK